MQNDKDLNFMKLPGAIIKNGVRLNDSVTLEIFQKGHRELKLNRTKFTIISGISANTEEVGKTMVFPALGYEKFHVEINLVEDNKEREGRYFIRSLSGDPFRINGNYAFSSFIERGDIVDIGFNKMSFKKTKSEMLRTSNISPSILKSKLPILIEGETGSGKTSLAKIIHEESGVQGSFVHINLASFSRNLIESELFGHVKGAFTGAINDKRGAFLEAHRGTLFLDEIDSIDLELQTKLLLFLDNFEFRPVGGNGNLKADVRLIFSSGKVLHRLVEEDKMRRDFYFRLKSGYFVRLKNLKDDPLSIKNLCLQFAEKEFVVMAPELIEFYQTLRWPGNIRQLIAHLQKKKILSAGKKLIYDEVDAELYGEVNNTKNCREEILTINELKFNHALHVYSNLNNNLSVSSKALGISQNTLRSILNKAA